MPKIFKNWVASLKIVFSKSYLRKFIQDENFKLA